MIEPKWKIFSSRSGFTDSVQQDPYTLTESQIFFCPARPNSVDKHFIIWLLKILNLNVMWLNNIRWPHAGQKDSTIKAWHSLLCFGIRQNSSNNETPRSIEYTITIHVNRKCYKINMGCENDLKMWIEEVTEKQKSHSIQILQICDRKVVLIVPILIGCLKANRKLT